MVTMAWLNFDHAQSNSKKWPKKIKLHLMKLSLEKQNFHYVLVPFIVQNKKKIWEQILSYEDGQFFGQNDPFPPNKILFRKAINKISICLLAPFTMQNCKTICAADSELWRRAILGPKWPKKHYFFRKSH